MTFNTWKARVDRELEKRLGMRSDELPDQPYYSWYENDFTPAEVVQDVLIALDSGLYW